MTLTALLAKFLLFAFVGGLLYLLWSIIRFSIIASFRTRNAPARMRLPDPGGLEGLVGFPAPAALVGFYSSWPHLEKTEYYLVDPATHQEWFIGGFLPLSFVDAREMIRASRVPGIPIASDMDKGVYFINHLAQVELWSPHLPAGRRLVADSIDELARFRVAEHEEINPDEDA